MMAIKERPIFFNGQMVPPVLAGTKTQTRRPNNLINFGPSKIWMHRDRWGIWNDFPTEKLIAKKSPFGVPGDRLWVRERTRVIDTTSNGDIYRAAKVRYESDGTESDWIQWPERLKRVPRGHCMANGCAREFSRITLEVTRVWVERVQNILENPRDAWAEGVECSCMSPVPICAGNSEAFQKLWDSIYGNWDENPWVWACEFKRVEGGAS